MIDIQRVNKLADWLVFEGIAKNRRDLAKKIGYTESSLSQILNGKVPLTEKFLKSLSILHDEINEVCLLTGEGEMLKERNGVIIITPEQIKETPKGTPIYDIDVTCGFDGRDFQDEQIVGYIDLPSIRKNTHIVTATGDSMYPKVCDGDRLVLRKIDSWDVIFFGQIYLVVTENYRMLKYVRKHPTDENRVILRSENDKYDDMIITKKDILKLFAVENILSIKNLM